MAAMQIVVVNKLVVNNLVVKLSGINLDLPTESCTPTKKAKEGHDLHFSVQPSKDIVPYNPHDADKVVAEPMGAMPKALHTSKYNMMSSFSNPFWTPKKAKEGDDPQFVMDPQFLMDPNCTDSDLVYLMRCKRNIEGEIKEFKYRKASAKGCVKQWQGQEALLKRAIEATESECLRYKEQWKDLNAKMTFKRGLAAECQTSIDINQAQLDQVNKRLRHLRR